MLYVYGIYATASCALRVKEITYLLSSSVSSLCDYNIIRHLLCKSITCHVYFFRNLGFRSRDISKYLRGLPIYPLSGGSQGGGGSGGPGPLPPP